MQAQPQAQRLKDQTMPTNTSLSTNDRVKLHPEVLQRHAQRVPAHMGYTREQFAWRDALRRLGQQIGVVERIFDNGHVNVMIGGGLIGIDANDLVKVTEHIVVVDEDPQAHSVFAEDPFAAARAFADERGYGLTVDQHIDLGGASTIVTDDDHTLCAKLASSLE